MWGFPKIRGNLVGPYNKDYSIVGSTLGSPGWVILGID